MSLNVACRVETTPAHLFGEAERARDVAVDAWLEDERAAAARALDPSLANQLAERVAHGDEATAVPFGELPLRGHALTRTPLVRVESGFQVPKDLVMQGNRSTFELEPRHSDLGLGVVGLDQRLLITL